MDFATMRTRFREAVGDRASDLNDASVDALLNTTWKFILPGEIDGVFREEDLSAVISLGTLNLDSSASPNGLGPNAGRIRQLFPGVRLSDATAPLDLYDDSETFYNRYRWEDVGVQTGKPQAVLLQKRILTIHPVPDTYYELVLPSSVYNTAIPASGLANDDWALAVVRITARDYAAEQGYDAIATRMTALSEMSKARMQAQSRARPLSNRESRRPFIDF